MAPTVAVFGSSATPRDDPEYAIAVECGRRLAEAGFTVATGGYAGTMEAVSKGAHEVGGAVIGVTAPTVFPHRSGANAFVSDERPAADLFDRFRLLIDGTDGAIALPGSIGTVAEVLVAWNAAYVAPMADRVAKPIVGVGDPWRSLVPYLEVLLGTEPGLVTVVDEVDQAVSVLIDRLGGA